jgi:hypothetical protein
MQSAMYAMCQRGLPLRHSWQRDRLCLDPQTPEETHHRQDQNECGDRQMNAQRLCLDLWLDGQTCAQTAAQ